MTTTQARFDQRNAQYKRIRACLEGEDEIKNAGQLYVPKPDGMTTQNYTHYIDRGAYYAAPEMTLRALTGLLLRKDPVVKLSARLEPMRLRATNDGAPLSVMIDDIAREVLSMGKMGLLLDFPPTGNDANTTPYFSTFVAEAIEQVDTAYINGQLEIVRVVLSSDEKHQGADVSFELCLEDTIYKMRRFYSNENKTRVDIGEEIIPTVNGKALNYIPFMIVSHETLRPIDVKPPMNDLCVLSLSHFKNSCDYEHALYLTGSPTPWLAGSITEDKVPSAIGAGTVWNLPEGTEVGMLEFTGAGVSAMKANMDSKLDHMATLGARMLSVTVNRNETIDTAQHRTRSELALLHGASVMIEAALNHMLGRAADWVGSASDEVAVTLSRDFIETSLDPKMIEQQYKLWMSGMISRATFWANLQQGEIAPASRTWDEERDLVEDEGGDLSPPVARVVA